MESELMDKQFYISGLIAKVNRGTISAEERKALDVWIKESEEHHKLYKRATDNKYLVAKLEVYQLFEKSKIRASLESELFESKTVWLVPKVYPGII
jgi:hypothetical protein